MAGAKSAQMSNLGEIGECWTLKRLVRESPHRRLLLPLKPKADL
jgi:hypothetical protein